MSEAKVTMTGSRIGKRISYAMQTILAMEKMGLGESIALARSGKTVVFKMVEIIENGKILREDEPSLTEKRKEVDK